MRTIIVATLLLASCGAAEASPTAKSTPTPATTASTAAPGITDAEAAFPARIAVTTKDGTVVTFSRHTDPIVTPGVMSPTGKVVVSASFMAGRTMVEWHDVRNDEIVAAVQIDGEFRPTAVGQDGKLVALIGSAGTSTTDGRSG